MVLRGVVNGCEETRDAIKVCFMALGLDKPKYNSHCVLVRASRWVGMEQRGRADSPRVWRRFVRRGCAGCCGLGGKLAFYHLGSCVCVCVFGAL